MICLSKFLVVIVNTNKQNEKTEEYKCVSIICFNSWYNLSFIAPKSAATLRNWPENVYL